MGEYADLQIREDIKRLHGFDPGDMDDDLMPKNRQQIKRVKCPYCGARVKEIGLNDHIRDVHKKAGVTP